jgi:hypothetical protein
MVSPKILKMNIFITNFKINYFQFLHFKIFLMAQTKYFNFFHLSWPILFKFQNENFHFKFQKWKFKIFISLCWYSQRILKTKNFISNSKNNFFSKFSMVA